MNAELLKRTRDYIQENPYYLNMKCSRRCIGGIAVLLANRDKGTSMDSHSALSVLGITFKQSKSLLHLSQWPAIHMHQYLEAERVGDREAMATAAVKAINIFLVLHGESLDDDVPTVTQAFFGAIRQKFAEKLSDLFCIVGFRGFSDEC